MYSTFHFLLFLSSFHPSCFIHSILFVSPIVFFYSYSSFVFTLPLVMFLFFPPTILTFFILSCPSVLICTLCYFSLSFLFAFSTSSSEYTQIMAQVKMDKSLLHFIRHATMNYDVLFVLSSNSSVRPYTLSFRPYTKTSIQPLSLSTVVPSTVNYYVLLILPYNSQSFRPFALSSLSYPETGGYSAFPLYDLSSGKGTPDNSHARKVKKETSTVKVISETLD